MTKYPTLKQYGGRLKNLGYDRMETVKHIAADDLATMNMGIGHRRLLVSVVPQHEAQQGHQGAKSLLVLARGCPTALSFCNASRSWGGRGTGGMTKMYDVVVFIFSTLTQGMSVCMCVCVCVFISVYQAFFCCVPGVYPPQRSVYPSLTGYAREESLVPPPS